MHSLAVSVSDGGVDVEEKISSEALQKNLPAVDEVSDPDSVSESAVTTVSGNDVILVPGTAVAAYSEDLFPVYDTYEEFMESPVYVTRYENELLSRLEFIQYALAIVIALLFLLIFKKK